MTNGVRATLAKSALAALAILAFALAGCGGGGDTSSGGGGGEDGGTPQAGGVLNVSQGAEILSLDPAVAVDAPSINAISQIMEPLYLADPEGQIEPHLALAAETSKDQLTWTIELREGVKFSDGKPMTAEDVVFSLGAAKKSANWAPLFEAFKVVKATSPSTVTIELTQPVPAMEALLSSYATVIVPTNYGGVSQEEFAEAPVGTGPFTLGTWRKGESLTLDKNPGYWEQGRPYLDKVVLSTVPDDTGRVSQLRGGQLDVIAAPPYSQLAGLESSPDLAVAQSTPAFSRYFQVNAEDDLFGDVRVREAIDLAIDREGIVQSALAGNGEVGGAFLSPAIPYHDEAIATTRDVEKAKELLAEAVADGASPSFTMLLEAGVTVQTQTSQVIQQNLEEVGFSVELQPLDSSALLETMSEGDYEAGILGLYPNVLDPSENVFFYIATEALFTKADTTAIGQLAERGSTTADPEKRRDIYAQIQEAVNDDHYTMTLNYEPWIWVSQADVSGFAVNPLNITWFADVGFSG